MMALYRVTAHLILVAWSVAAFADGCSGVGVIEGRVVDGANQSVVNVHVSAFPLECAVGGLLGAPAKTDAEGKFRLTGVLAGLTEVSTSKPESGYPDNSLAFYGVEYPPAKVVVRAGQATRGVVIRLTKSEVVAGRVLDQETSQPLLNARIRVSRIENDGLTLSVGVDFTGGFRFLLPNAKVNIEIRAEGYEPWFFTGLPNGVGLLVTQLASYVSVKSFGTRQLNVTLRKFHVP
jgi:hypothetical protein